MHAVIKSMMRNSYENKLLPQMAFCTEFSSTAMNIIKVNILTQLMCLGVCAQTCESVICLCGVLPSRREVEEHHAHSITEIFDAISYKKGSTVIRMLQGYLGADMFQQ
ncbi:uncharacterized protein LOC142637453 isoform X1 [Castanea sativa]|uniref:uncharacterized protein LOC142637453 isoform X1 n=1 Tax=Castanea sativa TaxID=21020 RepID=UPI003F6541CE